MTYENINIKYQINKHELIMVIDAKLSVAEVQNYSNCLFQNKYNIQPKNGFVLLISGPEK